MLSLTNVEIEFIRHQLQTACRLLQPDSAAREAFRTGLESLLLQTGRIINEAEARNYLAGILGPTCVAYGGEAPPQNSSPVCYAQVQGLRPGFEESDIVEHRESTGPATTDRLPPDRLPGRVGFKEMWPAIQNSVRQILRGCDPKSPAYPALEKQIEELVSVLYGGQPLNRS